MLKRCIIIYKYRKNLKNSKPLNFQGTALRSGPWPFYKRPRDYSLQYAE
jgi:hypothetical protein